MRLVLSRQERIKYLGFDDRWLMLLGIVLLAVVAQLFFIPRDTDLTFGDLTVCLGLGLFHTITYWTFNRGLIIYLRHHYPHQNDILKRVGIQIGAALLFILLVESLMRLVFGMLLPPGYSAHFGDNPLFYNVAVSFIFCLMVLGIYESKFFFVKYQQSLLEREKLAKSNMQAQLSALKQQVNPHFLFNSLNTLVNVIPEDPDLAVRFTQRLSAVYRRLLEYRHRDLITLGEELEALDDYVFLMQTRFENKFSLEVIWARTQGQWPPGSQGERSGSQRIAPLSLQLLVENAIKHNVVSRAHPLTVRIDIGEENITVSNLLRPRRQKQDSTGVGLQNIRRRYHLLTEREVIVDKSATHYTVTLPLLATEKSYYRATA